MASVTATEARSNFARTLERVQHDKEVVLIERWGRPVAALVPVERLRSLEESDTRSSAESESRLRGDHRTATDEPEDIEARRRAEIAEVRLADAIASLGDGIALFDAQDRLVLCNRAYQEWSFPETDTLVGREFEDMLREKVERGDYVGLDSEEAREAWLRDRMQAHREPAGPIEQKHGNGRWYRIHERRTQEGGSAIVTVDITEFKRAETEMRVAHDRLEVRVEARTKDLWRANRLLLQEITERKRIEEALRYSETRLAGILDIAPEAVIAIDDDQNIQLFNQGAEEIFGFSAGELVGRPVDILFPGHLRSALSRQVEEFAAAPDAGKTLSRRAVLTGRRRDGGEFPAEASIAKLELESGTIFTVLLRDVTERKASEAAMVAAKEKAELADRAKSEFLANISHELRTPLNAIIGFSEIMKRELLGPIGTPDYRDYADDIAESGQHLLQLINDILDLSKIETGKVGLDETEVDVDDMVEACRRLMAERAGKGEVSVTVTAPAGPRPALRADNRMLKQILVNLLSNAVKFTLPGGRVAVTTRHGPNEGYVFEVADTGIGIAAADMPKAMDRFGQVDSGLQRKFEGTGLGLPLTKSLVESHGGTLEIESEVGVGTTVTVRFPPERVVAPARSPNRPPITFEASARRPR